MRLTPLPRLLLLSCAAAILGGCSLPAQLAWSPDGSRAAYRVGDHAYLIDDQGHFLSELGPSAGGFAWSNDGQALYYAVALPDANGDVANAALAPNARHGVEGVPLGPSQPELAGVPRDNAAPQAAPEARGANEVLTKWFVGPAPTPRDPQFNPPDQVMPPGAVRVWRGGEESGDELFRLPDPIVYLTLSPDGQWLAAVTYHEVNTGGEAEHWFGHYVHNVESGQTSLLGWSGSWATAFAGPNRIAYVQPVRGVPVRNGDGQLVVVELPTRRYGKAQREVPAQLPGPVAWMSAVGDDLWFISMQRNPAGATEQAPDVAHLYRWVARTGGLERVAKDVGLLLVPSPDGQRVLYAQGGEDSKLVVMSNRGGSRHLVLDNWNGRALWPSWRTNDEIVLASTQPANGSDPDANGRVQYHAIVYRLPPDGHAEQLRVLSTDWDRSRLPYEQRGQAGPATRTTEPSTSTVTPTAPTQSDAPVAPVTPSPEAGAPVPSEPQSPAPPAPGGQQTPARMGPGSTGR